MIAATRFLLLLSRTERHENALNKAKISSEELKKKQPPTGGSSGLHTHTHDLFFFRLRLLILWMKKKWSRFLEVVTISKLPLVAKPRAILVVVPFSFLFYLFSFLLLSLDYVRWSYCIIFAHSQRKQSHLHFFTVVKCGEVNGSVWAIGKREKKKRWSRRRLLVELLCGGGGG